MWLLKKPFFLPWSPYRLLLSNLSPKVEIRMFLESLVLNSFLKSITSTKNNYKPAKGSLSSSQLFVHLHISYLIWFLENFFSKYNIYIGKYYNSLTHENFIESLKCLNNPRSHTKMYPRAQYVLIPPDLKYSNTTKSKTTSIISKRQTRFSW